MPKKPIVLIVEDSDSKLNSIQGVLDKHFPNAIIKTALSVRSAIDFLEKNTPDVIIADMSLPTYDVEIKERGGSPRPFGGIEVFEMLERYDINVPVLVVTSYPVLTEGSHTIGLVELSNRLSDDFPSMFIGTVYFDSSYSNWEHEIENHLTNIIGK